MAISRELIISLGRVLLKRMGNNGEGIIVNRTLEKASRLALILTGFSLIAPSYAFAYMDPGTGSYVFQIIIAALFGGLFALKQFWSKIVGLFKKSK